MHLVEHALVALVHVDLLLITATHGRPQLARQRVLALLQLTQQGWGDGDVVAAAGHTRTTQPTVQRASFYHTQHDRRLASSCLIKLVTVMIHALAAT